VNPEEKSTILVTCSPGLSEFVQNEAESLGFKVNTSHLAGVELEGSQIDAMRLNLHFRTAYNVLFLLKEFPCLRPEDLYREVKDFPWEEVISSQELLSVVGRVDTKAIDNSMFANLKVKDAIVDRIFETTGSRPDSGKEKTGVVIQFFWKDNFCRVFLNTSGVKISDRGYRRIPHKAPLRESLAAAIMMATGYDGTVPLVCPMCGSGTLAIEAALIATRRVPGLLRTNYGFMHTKYYDDAVWQEMRSQALKQSKKRGGKTDARPVPILATDIDPQAIEASRKNAMTAGVDHLVQFDVCDFADTPIPPGEGIVVMNPEYGERLGQIEELKATYERIGDFFKQKCAGYTGYVFTGNPDLAKKIGLRTSKRIILFNANIECRLLKFELYAGTRKVRQSEQKGD
jgi:putative N6-adenine-specific DNA methylase